MKLKLLTVALVILAGSGVDYASYKNNHRPTTEPTPVSEPVATPEAVPAAASNPVTEPTPSPAPTSSVAPTPTYSRPAVDLDPYKYSVPLNAGGSYTSPTINIPDYQPWSYTATPPVVTYPPVSNCHTILNC
jgi:hypothetical protein